MELFSASGLKGIVFHIFFSFADRNRPLCLFTETVSSFPAKWEDLRLEYDTLGYLKPLTNLLLLFLQLKNSGFQYICGTINTECVCLCRQSWIR